MIPAERIVRAFRHLVGDPVSEVATETLGRRMVELPPVELDLEDRATLARVWSGEAIDTDSVNAVELVRRVLVDTEGTDRDPRCNDPDTCACSWGQAYRFVRDRGGWRG